MKRAVVFLFMVIGCKRDRVEVAPEPSLTASVQSDAGVELKPPSALLGPVDAGPQKAIVYRVLDSKFVMDDAGVPRFMSITVQLEAGGTVIGPVTFPEPSCDTAPPTEPHGVSLLSCYYAGGGDYIEIKEKKPGEYVVIAFGQDESTGDQPHPPRENVRTLGKFHAVPGLSFGNDTIVRADGGAYKPYE